VPVSAPARLTPAQRELWNDLDMGRRREPSDGQTLAQQRARAAQDFVHICEFEGVDPPSEELVRAELERIALELVRDELSAAP
jgi:hypothetical protein